MTTESLADLHKLPLSDVKRILREAFPREDFRPPGKTLAPDHIRAFRDRLPNYLADRHSRPPDAPPPPPPEPAPETVADLPPAPRSPKALPARPGTSHRVFLHEDVLHFLGDNGESARLRATVKRIVREMLVSGRAQKRVKGTHGVNAGWLRAPLGDNSGYHYYLWHALQGQRPSGDIPLERGDVLVRAVRHHDACNTRLHAGAEGDYMILGAREYLELFESGGEADPLSPEQRRAFDSSSDATITKGHPGAGKTTLQLERTRRHDGHLLFLTFGEAQREQAEEWLRTYAPPDLAFDVHSHESFFRLLDPHWWPPPPTDDAAALMAQALQPEMRRLGPWRHHPGALHAELRAHFFGRALPVPFRDQPAVLDPAQRASAYRARRGGALGDTVAECVVRAANALPAEVLARLFGDVESAWAIARRLASGGAEALPQALREISGLFVDEVQDLTLVEVLACVLAARGAALGAGHRPAFHVAGDEGQTVRPTDFDWGELKDLVHALLGPPSEFELPGNVRAPKLLTQVINNSWDLYKTLGKSQRPRGYAEAEVDESSVGTVLWVDAADSFDAVLAVIERTPGAALVHPGFTVPRGVREAARRAGVALALGAPEAKGRDFRVVFVLDVGREAQRLWEMDAAGEDRAVVEIEQRLVVDSIRVAISRSTEVLVFVERAMDDQVRARLAALCGDEAGVFDGVVTEVRAEELEAQLDLDTSDRTDLVTELLSEFDATFADDAEAGLRLARRARQWLGDSNRVGAVQGRLRKEVYRAHGRALLRAGVRAKPEADIVDHLRRANRDLNLADSGDDAQLALQIRDLLAREPRVTPLASQVAALAVAAGGSGTAAEDALAALRRFAERLAAAVAACDDAHDWTRLCDTMDAAAEVSAAVPELATAARAGWEQAAWWSLSQKPEAATATRLAARAVAQLQGRRPDLEGRLAERQGHWTDAIRIYRDAGLTEDALRVSRRVGDDAARSLELARALPSEEALGVVERLARIQADLAALGPDDLTQGERDHLKKMVVEAVGRKR